MSELISAALAHKLANPTFPEGLSRYKDMVAGIISDAAMGGLTSINARVPAKFEHEIAFWLKQQDYKVVQLEDDVPEHSFYAISWSHF